MLRLTHTWNFKDGATWCEEIALPAPAISPIRSLSYVASQHSLVWVVTETAVSVLDTQTSVAPQSFLSTWPHQLTGKERLSVKALPGEPSTSEPATDLFSAIVLNGSGILETYTISITRDSPHSVSAETCSPSFSVLARQCAWPPALAHDVGSVGDHPSHAAILIVGSDCRSHIWLQRLEISRESQSKRHGIPTKAITEPTRSSAGTCKHTLIDFARVYDGE